MPTEQDESRTKVKAYIIYLSHFSTDACRMILEISQFILAKRKSHVYSFLKSCPQILDITSFNYSKQSLYQEIINPCRKSKPVKINDLQKKQVVTTGFRRQKINFLLYNFTNRSSFHAPTGGHFNLDTFSIRSTSQEVKRKHSTYVSTTNHLKQLLRSHHDHPSRNVSSHQRNLPEH
jgi:hypothetical protein